MEKQLGFVVVVFVDELGVVVVSRSFFEVFVFDEGEVATQHDAVDAILVVPLRCFLNAVEDPSCGFLFVVCFGEEDGIARVFRKA